MKKTQLKNTKPLKLRIKTGDEVLVISGNHKNQRGKVLSVDRVRNRAIVEGINLINRAMKPSASNPQGEFVEKEAPIHISNLKLIEPATGETTRVGRKVNDQGKLQRYSKKTGDFIG
ncbi:large subunit ribosomal protein L24 [Catalinimonas alkaloidigena]|uniref:Large ribosomal subunit protein uL24 n=1 Tax=Catalinimonas alkaloidigena TaxID=1075417 RepID=A0A1G9Q6K0_9BACT|nr:50S ribosomal protein L24 [Catalinimonas alkaloidigena]SDM06674.1 large subunit ribosomal protein L24 [Catalinimonas alkaloidigena]